MLLLVVTRLVALVFLLVSGNTQVLPTVEAGGGHCQEGGGRRGARHRTTLPCQQEAVRQEGKTSAQQGPPDHILGKVSLCSLYLLNFVLFFNVSFFLCVPPQGDACSLILL